MNRQTLRRLEALEQAAIATEWNPVIHTVECDLNEPLSAALERAGIQRQPGDIVVIAVSRNYEPNA